MKHGIKDKKTIKYENEKKLKIIKYGNKNIYGFFFSYCIL